MSLRTRTSHSLAAPPGQVMWLAWVVWGENDQVTKLFHCIWYHDHLPHESDTCIFYFLISFVLLLHQYSASLSLW